MSMDIYAEVERGKQLDLLRIQAEEIYNYMVMCLADGVFITDSRKEEMLNELTFMLESS